MGYFDACANPIRTDSAGRPVLAPLKFFGRVYLLSDEAEVARVKRGFKWLQIVSFVCCIAFVPKFFFLAIPPILALQATWVYVLTRGLTRTTLRVSDLPRMPRPEALARTTAAMGKPTVTVVLILGAILSASQLWAAIHFGGPEFWFGATLFTVLTGLLIENIITARNYRRSVQRSRTT